MPLTTEAVVAAPRFSQLAAHWLPDRTFVLLLAGSVVLRVVLAPLWHGQDFTVWTLATSATLGGVDVFAHHPAYPGGPFAYVPLFLYVELPLRWLSDVTGASYVLLGKLPMVIADAVIGRLLYGRAIRGGWTPCRAALLSAGYLLNPLVLYNGAIYGRFDALPCALLLASTEHLRKQGRVDAPGALGLALATAAKTFPVFTLPIWLTRRSRQERWTVAVMVMTVVAVLSAPYLGSAGSYLRDVIGYDSGKRPQGSTLWVLLNGVASETTASVVSGLGLVVFAVGALWIARRTPPVAESLVKIGTGRRPPSPDVTLEVGAILLLFVASSKVVLEQYLTWPLPWLLALLVSAPRRQRRASVLVVGLLTVVGLANCESFHPFGRNVPGFGLVLVAAVGWFLTSALNAERVP